MKKVFLLLVILLLTDEIILHSEVMLAVKKGVNISCLYGYNSNTFKPGPVAGFIGGIHAEISLIRSLLLQPEILFSQKGGGEYGTSHNVWIRLTCIDFPLVIKLGILKSPVIWSVYSGAQVSAVLGGSIREERSPDTTSLILASEDLSGFTAGMVFGTEVGVPIGGSRIFLDLRYVIEAVPPLTHSGARNQILSVFLGYGFTI